MKRIQISKNFYLDEFVDPTTYGRFGANSRWFVDTRIVAGVQFMRDKMGPLTINDWANGGRFRLSGLRPFETSIGSKWSQHKYKNGADIKSAKYSPDELHEFLKANEDLYIQNQWVTTIEKLQFTPTWTHVDNRNTGLDKFLFVNG